jgi:hypothetical protein
VIAVRDEHQIASACELEPGQGVWANARGYWRMARVARVGRTRAVVVFRLAASGTLRRQSVSMEWLRRWTWAPVDPATAKFSPPPTFDEAKAMDLRP